MARWWQPLQNLPQYMLDSGPWQIINEKCYFKMYVLQIKPVSQQILIGRAALRIYYACQSSFTVHPPATGQCVQVILTLQKGRQHSLGRVPLTCDSLCLLLCPTPQTQLHRSPKKIKEPAPRASPGFASNQTTDVNNTTDISRLYNQWSAQQTRPASPKVDDN